jgi:hypothetical protein
MARIHTTQVIRYTRLSITATLNTALLRDAARIVLAPDDTSHAAYDIAYRRSAITYARDSQGWARGDMSGGSGALFHAAFDDKLSPQKVLAQPPCLA